MKKNFLTLNKKLKIYKSFKKSKFRSLKHDNYFFIYEEIFKLYLKKKITLVEIGVANGGSLFMWKDYFKKNSKIIGIDFNPTAKKWTRYGFNIFIGNQKEDSMWKTFLKKTKKIDILIDDGGHTNEQQINTFNSVVKKINEGGVILFEDTHCSYLKNFGNPSNFSFINFAFSVVNKINQNNNKKLFNYNYQKYVYKVTFYNGIVAFHIDKNKCIRSSAIDNGGKILNANDYAFNDTPFNHLEKIKPYFRKILNKFFYSFLKNNLVYIKFIYFKIKSKKFIKYFS